MTPKIERVIENLLLGEGPHWDEETQSLYLVDLVGKAIYRYVPTTKKHTKAVLDPKSPSLIIPLRGEKNKFVVALDRELATITWDGESDKVSIVKKLAEVENPPDSRGTRFNDGKCDPSGRLWLGTMGAIDKEGIEPDKASFYSFQNNKLTTLFSKVGISNGLAFNAEIKKSYYIDSLKGSIDEFDFDIEEGTIANRKSIFTLSKHDIPGFPDGMTIDTDGNLWVAASTGARIIKIDPRKPETLLDTIHLPANQVTSMSFGGPNLDELYVTTASVPLGTAKPSPPDDGAVLRITGLSAKGLPGVSAVL